MPVSAEWRVGQRRVDLELPIVRASQGGPPGQRGRGGAFQGALFRKMGCAVVPVERLVSDLRGRFLLLRSGTSHAWGGEVRFIGHRRED